MNRKVEFFYDYVSPYTYLANSQLANLNADIVYRPVLLGALMQSIGNQPPATLAARGNYLFADVRRWAAYYQIPYAMNPAFPVNTIKALRVALVADEMDRLDLLHQPLFDAVWAHGLDVNDDSVLTKIISDAGLVPDEIYPRITDDDIKARLRSNTDEAIERGVFGAPTFFVGDEMFFGNDRLHFVKAELEKAILLA
ncbi:MAG: 2-hydroxychromene-2-carboxylate isomerase [Woeseiaceae bacterium]|jgi:2-hydroxychromene-2-carboxylate isomerase